MADYWVDLPQLRTDGARILRWVRTQGVIMCCDPAGRVRVKMYLLPVFWALEKVIRLAPLVALYLYRHADQPPNLRTTDGTPMRNIDWIVWKDVTRDRGELYAIGLSCEALEQGPESTQFLFLHELIHALGNGVHSPDFHQQLDRLIEQFKRRTVSPLGHVCLK